MPRAKRRVYVVDDDPVIRVLLGAVLNIAGYTVAIATSGAEAVAGVATVQPDAVILDAMMPGMDGYACCEAIRHDTRLSAQPYVLLLTAASSGTEAERARVVGIDEVMAKPFKPAQLLSRLQEVLA